MMMLVVWDRMNYDYAFDLLALRPGSNREQKETKRTCAESREWKENLFADWTGRGRDGSPLNNHERRSPPTTNIKFQLIIKTNHRRRKTRKIGKIRVHLIARLVRASRFLFLLLMFGFLLQSRGPPVVYTY